MMSNNNSDFLHIAIDIGNSRVKLFDGKRFCALEYSSEENTNVSSQWEQQCRSTIDSFLSDTLNSVIVGISSVNPIMTNTVKSILQERYDDSSIKLVEKEELLAHQHIIDVSNIEGMGSDRIFGLIGAMEHYATALVTIDCGTAFTINAVDDHGVCLGGHILPGLRTQFRALHHFTQQLPEIQPKMYNTADVQEHLRGEIGNTTHSAIQIGVQLGLIGAIKELSLNVYKHLQVDTLTVVFTGGDASFMEPLFRHSMEVHQKDFSVYYQPHLVLEGIQAVLQKLPEHT
jgi:type III pantothenate kinase